MHRYHLVLLTLVLTTSLLAPSSAQAFTLIDDEEHSASIGAFARTRLSADLDEEQGLEPGASVVMARIQARAHLHDLGAMMVHIETTQSPAVLDAFIDVNLGSPVGLTMGKMRMPLSRELLINIPVLPVYTRTLLSSTLAPRRRVGALAHATWQLSTWTLLAQYGVFNPTAQLNASQDGLLMLGSIDLTHATGLNLHIAAMNHVLKSTGSLPMDVATYPAGAQLDAALFYDTAHLRVLTEALVTKPELTDNNLSYGVHGLVAYMFTPDAHRFAYEPAISVDIIRVASGQDIERYTANMHWLLHGRDLQFSLGYGIESRATPTQKMLMELQAGF